MTLIKSSHPLAKPFYGALVDLPSPGGISYFWNFGSLLGLCLATQLATGVFLAIHYSSDTTVAFSSVTHLLRDVNLGWLIRMIHANGGSAFFVALYLHAGRGIYYGSYAFSATWSVGSIILLATMAAAFLGYVLPWGQMSFWGATVITNLVSAIPYMGQDIVVWLWGGFAVDNPTLVRFFAFHFLVPFIIAALVLTHLMFLHETGSNNPLGLSADSAKLAFHPLFSLKDSLGVIMFMGVLLTGCFFWPWGLGDPENFIPANPLVAPLHIQPEWYFLFAYAILRSIPNKLGGVMALAGAVLILLVLPLLNSSNFRPSTFYPLSKMSFWALVVIFGLLTWIGARPVEDPYILVGQILSVVYFGAYALTPLVRGGHDWASK